MSFTVKLLLFFNAVLLAGISHLYLNANQSSGDIVQLSLNGQTGELDGKKEWINPNDLTYEQRMEKIKMCRPFLREYEDPPGTNPDLDPEFPPYIPVFKEKPNAIGYDYDPKKYKSSIAQDWGDYNPLRVLGYYSQEIGRKYYNANPKVKRNFLKPHMGIFNDENYCDVHDMFILNNPEAVLNRTYYLSDYHPFSIPRMMALSHFGKDTNPKISKNMKPINFHQRLYPIDVRTSIFYFKYASFHHFHKIGKHFGCWGQSYNHIPGHGHLIRKDLLVTSANDYIKKYREADQEKCFTEGQYFPQSYRLYNEQECKAYFEFIKTTEHKKEAKISEVQFVLKVGAGVHRGAGVYLIDFETERKLIANYSDGEKCGEIKENLVTQKYIYDIMTIDDTPKEQGYKFDFRIYMMVVSVNPLIVYYHDGFLRVSLFKYSLTNLDYKAHLTNTELAKEIFKKVGDGGTHHGMDVNQLREFQMRTLDQFGDYLYQQDPKRYKDFINKTLKPEFKKSYIHLSKMIQKKVLNSSNFFEVYGVDFVMDRNDKIYIVEVNPSPMMVGTSPRKTELMRNLNQGIVKLALSYLKSRFKRTLHFIKLHRNQIMKGENIEQLKEEFQKLDRNYLEPEFAADLKDLSWEPVIDENKKGTPGYLNGLITPECEDSMNIVDAYVSETPQSDEDELNKDNNKTTGSS
jgi:Tubulin-tyrosine ligase family